MLATSSAWSRSLTTMHLLLPSDVSAISQRGSSFTCFSTSALTASATERTVVTRTTWLSGPCSAWERRSEAAKAGLQVSSATTITSEGPAGMSMDTPALCTRDLAAMTY